MNNGSIDRSNKHRPVVIHVDDGDDQVSGAPQRGATLICCHHSEVEAFRRLKQPLRTDQSSDWVQGEGV